MEVTVLPDKKSVSISSEESILDASLSANIPHAHACGGNAICSTCRIVILDGHENVAKRNSQESDLAKALHFSEDVRLACQTKVTGNVTVNRPVLDEIDLAITNQYESSGQIGQEKEVAILFTDIESYTPFAEALPAYDVIHVLDKYFYLMGNAIRKNRGTIIDYYGDGVLVVFGLENPEEPALQGVRSVKDMREALNKLNPYLEKMYGRGFSIRSGLHFGKVIVGTIGIKGSRKLTAIGDAVNYASRIESANKQYGTRFMISEPAFRQVKKHVKTGKEVEVELKGKKGLYRLFEVTEVLCD